MKLGFGKLPDRKRYCFFLSDGNKIIPVAYVHRPEYIEDIKKIFKVLYNYNYENNQ